MFQAEFIFNQILNFNLYVKNYSCNILMEGNLSIW